MTLGEMVDDAINDKIAKLDREVILREALQRACQTAVCDLVCKTCSLKKAILEPLNE